MRVASFWRWRSWRADRTAPAENARSFWGSFLLCGTSLETSAGTAGLEKPDLEKANILLKESGYDGRTVIFMQPSDLGANFSATVVVAEAMRRAGLKVQQRAKRLVKPNSRWSRRPYRLDKITGNQREHDVLLTHTPGYHQVVMGIAEPPGPRLDI
jgi:hypothetical protein